MQYRSGILGIEARSGGAESEAGWRVRVSWRAAQVNFGKIGGNVIDRQIEVKFCICLGYWEQRGWCPARAAQQEKSGTKPLFIKFRQWFGYGIHRPALWPFESSLRHTAERTDNSNLQSSCQKVRHLRAYGPCPIPSTDNRSCFSSLLEGGYSAPEGYNVFFTDANRNSVGLLATAEPIILDKFSIA